ncbi:MAG: TlpA family protein disulfide reductase [Flavobacteriales bacterium]
MRTLLIGLSLLLSLHLQAGSFTIQVTARGFGDDIVSLYRYADLFTNRTVLVQRGILDAKGQATLTGEAEGTQRVQLRIGERIADLYVRPGSTLHITPFDLGTARSLSGTTRMGLDFTDIDALDVNALTADVNERIDAFVAEDLATDEAAGMQALDIQRKEGSAKPDSAARPATLFVTPQLSKARVDTFAMKLRAFYAEVKDPWFAHYLEHSIASLYIGPRSNDRELFDTFVKGKPVRYDDPEYVRLIRTLFGEGVEQLSRYKGDSLRMAMSAGDPLALRTLFQGNDFLRSDDRLAELVMIDQLYLNHTSRAVNSNEVVNILRRVAEDSPTAQHRTIAANMVWDLTAMRVGAKLPAMRLEDERGQPMDLIELLQGPVCVAFTAGWCTYCTAETGSLITLAEEGKGTMKVVVIGLDRTLDEFKAAKKAMPPSAHVTWLHAVAEQQVREDARIRSLPQFFILNDDVLARAPAPLPSKGLAELFFKARTEAEKSGRLKVWDD